jgi:hypothetical protein
VVGRKAGVVCKSCGEKIEVEDDYIPGIRGAELAASFYQPTSERSVDFVNRDWHTTLICGNPDCQQTHEYTGSDLLLYNG